MQIDLMEERMAEEAKPNSEIVYMKIKLPGKTKDLMMNTVANNSLINKTELN